MISRKTVMLAILAGSLLAPTAFARGPHGGKGRHGKHMKKVLEALDLTEAQKTKIKEIRKSGKDSVRNKREDARKHHEELHAAMLAGKSKAELSAMHEKIIAGKTAMMRARFEQMLAIRDVLTEEQRAAFFEAMQRRHGRHHRGGPGGPGGPDSDDDLDL